jgi:hypothetical protein
MPLSLNHVIPSAEPPADATEAMIPVETNAPAMK